MNPELSSCRRVGENGLEEHRAGSPVFAEKIVKIAGIGRGDRVLPVEDPSATIEAAIVTAGGVILSAADCVRRGTPPVHADVILLTGRLKGRATCQWLRNLRPGGRLVVWRVPGPDHGASFTRERFRQLMNASGFTSVIVGQLPACCGGAVVATGILKGFGQPQTKCQMDVRSDEMKQTALTSGGRGSLRDRVRVTVQRCSERISSVMMALNPSD